MSSVIQDIRDGDFQPILVHAYSKAKIVFLL